MTYSRKHSFKLIQTGVSSAGNLAEPNARTLVLSYWFTGRYITLCGDVHKTRRDLPKGRGKLQPRIYADQYEGYKRE